MMLFEVRILILFEVKIMKEKLQRFMMGRYGVDAFSKFLLGAAMVLWILDMFVDSRILYSWALLLLIYSYYRIFSRDTTKRYQENLKFLALKQKFMSKCKALVKRKGFSQTGAKSNKSNWEQRKTHHIYKCPTCKQKIRIPRGKGRICITCPKCKTEFTKTS